MSLGGWEAFDMKGVGSVISDLAIVWDKAANDEVSATAAGKLEIFAIGADHALWQLALRHHERGPKNRPVWQWSSLGKPDKNTSLVPTDSEGRIAIAQNADGRLEIFALGTGGQAGQNGSLFHKWQVAVGGPWSNWAKFDDPIEWNLSITDLQVSRKHNGALDVFVRDKFGGLAHIAQTAPNNGWGVWKAIGAPPDHVMYHGGTVPTFGVGLNAAGIQEVFATGDYWGLGDGKFGYYEQKWIWRSAEIAPNSAEWGPWEWMLRPITDDNRMTIGLVNLNWNGLLELFVNDAASIYVMNQSAAGVWDLDWYDLNTPTVYAQGGYAVGRGWRALEVFAWGQTPGDVAQPNALLWRIRQGTIDKFKPSGVNPSPKPFLYWDREDWEQLDANDIPGKPAYFTNGGFRVFSGLHLNRNQSGTLDIIAAGADRNVYANWQT